MTNKSQNAINTAISAAGSQKALSILLGVSPPYVNQIKQGKRPFSTDHVALVNSVFGLSLESEKTKLQNIRLAQLKEIPCDT